MIWNRFDENEMFTYPPIGRPVLISYNKLGYMFDGDIVGWATLERILPDDVTSDLYWRVKESTPETGIGSSPLEKSRESWGRFSDPWVFVKHWAILEPYNDNT